MIDIINIFPKIISVVSGFFHSVERLKAQRRSQKIEGIYLYAC